jgi:aryl-alcohol dehydrogenase-like predicted oxidoreductase
MASTTPLTRSLAGVDVFPIGLGEMPMSLKGRPDEEQSIRTIHAALDAGVNLIDTADAYARDDRDIGHGERLIAKALKGRRDDVLVATKGGHTRPGGDWDVDGSPAHLRAACEASLRALETDRIDLYQYHRPDPRIPYAESVGALKELQDEGKIRLIGVSNVSTEQLAQARGIVDVVSVQNRFNLTDRATEDELDQCEKDGIGFIPWFPLAVGKLAESGGPLDEIAAAHDAAPSQVALAWLLQRSPVMLPIPGTSSVEHLEENVAAAGLELTADEVEALNHLAD